MSASASYDNRHAKSRARVAFYRCSLGTNVHYDKNLPMDTLSGGYPVIGSLQFFLRDRHNMPPEKLKGRYYENALFEGAVTEDFLDLLV